jgi:hypothetical protein
MYKVSVSLDFAKGAIPGWAEDRALWGRTSSADPAAGIRRVRAQLTPASPGVLAIKRKIPGAWGQSPHLISRQVQSMHDHRSPCFHSHSVVAARSRPVHDVIRWFGCCNLFVGLCSELLRWTKHSCAVIRCDKI